MAYGQAAFADAGLEGGRQLEEAQSVGHRGAALADFRRHILLLELKLLDELRVAVRLFNSVQVLALQVLDQSQFQHGPVVGLPEDDGDFRQAEQLGGPPAAFAGDELEVAVAISHDQRLDDALFLDGISQLAQRLGGEIFAGLQRAGANTVQRHALDALTQVGRRSGTRGCG